MCPAVRPAAAPVQLSDWDVGDSAGASSGLDAGVVAGRPADMFALTQILRSESG